MATANSGSVGRGNTIDGRDKHLHTKAENMDKLESLTKACINLNLRSANVGRDALGAELGSLAQLAVEVEYAINELREQTGIE